MPPRKDLEEILQGLFEHLGAFQIQREMHYDLSQSSMNARIDGLDNIINNLAKKVTTLPTSHQPTLS